MMVLRCAEAGDGRGNFGQRRISRHSIQQRKRPTAVGIVAPLLALIHAELARMIATVSSVSLVHEIKFDGYRVHLIMKPRPSTGISTPALGTSHIPRAFPRFEVARHMAQAPLMNQV
jgi:hypothetical protein